jgi:CBS domain-containing protein
MTTSPPWRKPAAGCSFRRSVDHEEASMKTAADLLKSKADQSVHTITPAASVFDALKLMADKDVGALLVMEGDKVAGIITERDYARKIALMSRLSAETEVREIMTSAVMYVHPSQTTEECMVLMTESRLRHLPVIDGGELLGLISIGDIVKDIIREQKFMIQQLEHYISG